ncbi:GTPase activating protein [Blyttiomyces sp. JEL0837]|nr:GTPase activating protein [Blyttiomyces sp. JEL0837]
MSSPSNSLAGNSTTTTGAGATPFSKAAEAVAARKRVLQQQQQNNNGGTSSSSSSSSVANTDDLPKVKLLWVKSNVAMRSTETRVLVGFLALCQSTTPLPGLPATTTAPTTEVEASNAASTLAPATVTSSSSLSTYPPSGSTSTLNITTNAPPTSPSLKPTNATGTAPTSPSLKPTATTTSGSRSPSPSARPSSPNPGRSQSSAAPPPPPRESLLLAWIPKRTAAKADLQAFRDAAAATRSVITPPVSPSSSQSTSSTATPTPTITISKDSMYCPLVQIAALTFESVLTLTQGGDSACLVKMALERELSLTGLSMEEANATNVEEDENVLVEELWFERDENYRDIPLVEVVDEISWWMASVGLGLRIVETPIVVPTRETTEEESGTPNPAALVCEIVDRGIVVSGTSGGVGNNKDPQKDWPVSLPISADSVVYRLGAFGLGMAATIVGPTISNKVEDVARSAAWDVMERFSRVTKFAQNTGRQVVEHPFARPILPLIPNQIRTFILSSVEAETLVQEYDSAGHYLAHLATELQGRISHTLTGGAGGKTSGGGAGSPKKADPATVDHTRDFEVLTAGRECHRTPEPLTAEEWIGFYDVEGVLTISPWDARKKIFYGGVEDDIRCEVWKFLLNVYRWDSTEAQRTESMKIIN